MSILGAATSLGTLLGALVNLMTCEYKEAVSLQANQSDEQWMWERHGYVWTPVRKGGGLVPVLRESVRYPDYWIEDAVTIVLAASIFVFGAVEIARDTRAGVRWYTLSFWREDAEAFEAAHPEPGGESGGPPPRLADEGARPKQPPGPTETTPLTTKR